MKTLTLLLVLALAAPSALAISATKAEIGQSPWKVYVCRVFRVKACVTP